MPSTDSRVQSFLNFYLLTEWFQGKMETCSAVPLTYAVTGCLLRVPWRAETTTSAHRGNTQPNRASWPVPLKSNLKIQLSY